MGERRGRVVPRLTLMVRALAVALAAVLISSCGGGPAPIPEADEPTPTASGPMAAQQWFATRAEAQRQGLANVAAFYAREVQLDHSAIGLDPATGRVEALQVLEKMCWYRLVAVEPVYLASDAAVTIDRVRDRSSRVTELRRGSVASVYGMSAAGITHSLLAPGAAEIWPLSMRTVPSGPRIDDAVALAEAYVAAWSRGDPEEVGALYARAAELADSVHAVQARGRDQVADLAARPGGQGGLAGARLRVMPGSDAPAVYIAGPWAVGEPIDHLLLLARADGESLAVELRLNSRGRIIEEKRLHRVDSLARTASDPAGWWDDVTIPAPVPRVSTGSVTLGATEVETFNASPGLVAMLVWAAGRFSAAGLEPPALASVTFHDPAADLCQGINGQMLGDDVILCYRDRSACANAECTDWNPQAKGTLLHELGHIWINENVDGATRSAIRDKTGLPTWDSAKHPWEDRAVEVAATAIACGLMDEPFAFSPRLAARTCADLAEPYELMTGSPPPHAAWPEP